MIPMACIIILAVIIVVIHGAAEDAKTYDREG